MEVAVASSNGVVVVVGGRKYKLQINGPKLTFQVAMVFLET
jgi:hypothetical protein